MSASSNPDRIYVNRQHRAKIRLDEDGPTPHVALPGIGATLQNVSQGGCCLRLNPSELPGELQPGSLLPSIKLLHPALDSTPIEGRVAWSRADDPGLLVGVQFLFVRPATLESIRAYLDSRTGD